MKDRINYKTLIILIFSSIIFWNLPIPEGLNVQGWHVLTIFITTITAIILSPLPMPVMTLMSICALVLTNTISINEALSGLSMNIAWLVVLAFFIAKGFIKTGLGKRVAYLLISKFGKTTLGLSYSLILTEFILSPLIPSATARGGGIIYPIVNSLAGEYSKKTASFLISICFHNNVITCALFLTAMAGNPLVVKLAADLGINISWSNWAMTTIIPGIANLLLLPFIVGLVIKPDMKRNEKVVMTAKNALQEIGPLTSKEIIMIMTFLIMIILWIIGPLISVDSTTTALLGFLALILTGVINWNDAVTEKGAWDTLIWFSTLLMLSGYLTKFGVTNWVESSIKAGLSDNNGALMFVIIGGLFFYIHYLFASVTAHVTVMYTTFLIVMIHLKAPPFLAAMILAILSNLSGSLTHYGIASAPIYFGAGYMNIKEWWKVGFVVGTVSVVIWLAVGSVWWKIIGLY